MSPVTATLSVDGAQVRFTCVGETAVATTFVGVDGGVTSETLIVDVHVRSSVPGSTSPDGKHPGVRTIAVAAARNTLRAR
jgi:hypothetical protein